MRARRIGPSASRLSLTRPRVLGVGSNTVALSALVHGYSGKPDLAKMVNAFYLQVAGLRTSVYFDYVPSKANIADLPSRGAVHELAARAAWGAACRTARADGSARAACWTLGGPARIVGASFPAP